MGDEAGGNGERCQLVMVMEVEGPLFFASGFHLRQVLNRLEGYRCVVLDMAGMPFLDVTGTEVLEEGILLLKRKGSDVVLARPTDSVRERLRNLARSQFHALLECPVYDDLRDAMLHAARLVEPDHLCGPVPGRGAVQGPRSGLESGRAVGTEGRAPRPRARRGGERPRPGRERRSEPGRIRANPDFGRGQGLVFRSPLRSRVPEGG